MARVWAVESTLALSDRRREPPCPMAVSRHWGRPVGDDERAPMGSVDESGGEEGKSHRAGIFGDPPPRSAPQHCSIAALQQGSSCLPGRARALATLRGIDCDGDGVGVLMSGEEARSVSSPGGFPVEGACWGACWG